MAEYKRKKIHTGLRRPKKVQVQKVEENIPMRSSKRTKSDITQDSAIRVVKGKKGEKRKKLYVFCGVVTVIALTLVVLSLFLPVGLYESTKNFALSLGSGSFPLELSGTQTLNCVPKDKYYYVLTDTSVIAFSNGGKKIFSFAHGFSSPIITTSETRALVYDQGKNAAAIYNLSGVVDIIDCKDEIIAADISRDGQYALVTKSESCASCVTVYNRKGETVFSIKLAKDMVNNIDIASSGEKIAISTINAQSGKMSSSLCVYGFNSADPDFKLDLGEDLVYQIQNTGRGFYVATHNKLRYINWSKHTVNEIDFDGEIASMRYSNTGTMVVYNKTNDKSNNNIVLFSNSGKKISEFEIKGIVNDIRFSRGRVYTIGDNKLTIFDKQGKILRSDGCGFGGVKISVVGSNTICIISDNEIQKTVIKKGE